MMFFETRRENRRARTWGLWFYGGQTDEHGLSMDGVQVCGRVMICEPMGGLRMDASSVHGVQELHAGTLNVMAE